MQTMPIWKTNPEGYTIKKITVDAKTTLTLKLAKGGGAAVSIKPISAKQNS